jgi:hypothetical protein
MTSVRVVAQPAKAKDIAANASQQSRLIPTPGAWKMVLTQTAWLS